MTENPDHNGRYLRRDRAWLHASGMLALGFVVLIWAVWLLSVLLEARLYTFGIYPGSFRGLLGVLLAPLLHGSLEHIVSNSLPAFILGTALIYAYPMAARFVIPIVWIGAGIGVWLFGRESYHIGASGLNYGMMAFLCVIGAIRRDRRSVAVAFIVFFLYGSMIWGVFPGEPNVSFESHLAGAVIGIVLAIIMRGEDRRPPEKVYAYELEEAREEYERIHGVPWPDDQ